jgi:hypothetical protein
MGEPTMTNAQAVLESTFAAVADATNRDYTIQQTYAIAAVMSGFEVEWLSADSLVITQNKQAQFFVDTDGDLNIYAG